MRANYLGKAMRYVTDAVAYASQSFKQGVNPMLRRVLFDSTRVSGSGVGEEGDVQFYLRLAATNPAVLSAITTIADRVNDSSLFTVQSRQQGAGWLDIEEHPFITLLRSPNSIMSGSLLLSDTTWWYKLLGNAYWFLVTDAPGQGRIHEIWPLPADRVHPDPTTMRISPITGKPILDYKYTLGSLITLPGENVVHFRTANPFDPWRGLSALSALQGTLRTDNAQSTWLGSYYGQGNAVPASVISLPPNISDEDFDAVKEDIKEQFGGKRQTAVVRSGDFKVEVIQHSIADMQVIDHKKHNAQEIRSVFKIPEGLSSATSGQSRLAAETALARDAVQPVLNYFAETFSLFVLRYYDNDASEIRCEAEDIVPQDEALQISKYKTYAVDRTLNENREEQGLKPIILQGDLARLQPLLDQVPQGMMAILSPLILQPAAPAAPALPSMPQPFRVIDGQASAPRQLPGTPAQLPDSTPGYRISGLPDEIDPIQAMLGKGMSVSEKDAMLYTMLNQFVKGSDLDHDMLQMLMATLILTARDQDNAAPN